MVIVLSMWRSWSWSVECRGSPWNTELNGLIYTQAWWEHPGTTLAGRSFQSSGGRLQKWVWVHFSGVLWVVRPSKTWQLPLRSTQVSQLCHIRRDEQCQAWVQMWMFCVNVTFPKAEGGRTVGMIKSTIPPTSQDLLLICLKAWLVVFNGGCSPLCHMWTRGLLLHT